MPPPRVEQVLSEAERSLKTWGRLALCQIVRAEGSTPGKVGWKLVVRPDGTATGNLGGGAFEGMVRADAAAKLSAGTDSEIKRYYFTEEAIKGEPTGMVCGGMAEVFLEVLQAAPLLAICGGGPVGQALAHAAVLAGFDLLIADDREEFRRPELFPDGSEFASVDREYTGYFLAPFARRDLFVAIVSRCWETDTAALAAVLRAAPPRLRYLGLMGSRRKIERVRSEVAARGGDLATVDLRAPIGLPIGGDAPGEIAISIVAEMIRDRHAAPDPARVIGLEEVVERDV